MLLMLMSMCVCVIVFEFNKTLSACDLLTNIVSAPVEEGKKIVHIRREEKCEKYFFPSKRRRVG